MKNLKNLTLVSVLIAAAGLGAQENVGTINGTVRNASGAPVANALVRISGPQLLQPRETSTDAQGRYMIRLLLPGTATVVANKEGFVGARKIVTITAGSTLLVDLNLRSAAVLAEEVEILGSQNPIFDKTESKVASTFTAQELYNLPTGYTGVYAAMSLAPGVAAGSEYYAKVRGGTYGQAMYSINGISMRDPVAGQGRQFEFTFEDMIQDVQVVQNTINAKYGFTNSGSVNITTKTGNNSFQGSVRVELSNPAWRTYNSFPVNNRWGGENEQGSIFPSGWHTGIGTVSADNLSRNYYVTLSGPIIKDKLTFVYGARYQPKTLTTIGFTNPIYPANLEWNSLYLPNLLEDQPKFTGPNYNNPNGPQVEWWAAYLYGRNPLAPNAAYNRTGERSTSFDQYKLFWQITPYHQLDINYSKDTLDYIGSNRPSYTMDPDVLFRQTEDRPMVGFNYRGLIGDSAVVTLTWGRRKNVSNFPSGPGDPIWVTAYDDEATGIFERTGFWTGMFHENGAASAPQTRDSETAALDVNYIWQSHNFDVGLQKLNERSTGGGVGINNREFFVPGRRYDGLYLVMDVSDPASPLSPSNLNPGFRLNAGETVEDRRLWLMNNARTRTNSGYATYNGNGTRVPKLYKYSAGEKTFTPHDAQQLAFYVNDNWTISDNLALNLGLRFDKTTVNEVKGETVNVLDINPRLRVQYDLFGDNRHVFHGALTQSIGAMNRAMLEEFANFSRSPVMRVYAWTGNSGANKTPKAADGKIYFVTQAELLDEDNYQYYHSYNDSSLPYTIDKGTGPEKTTSLDFGYRRAFSQGGYFRVSLVYNFLNRALYAEVRDKKVVTKDPTGATVATAAADDYERVLYNRDDRVKHFASAEMEFMMPVVTKPTWSLNWNGNWTISKTTGNAIFNGSFMTNNAEGRGYWFREQVEKIGMPVEMYDPYGETGGTPRHSVKSWITWNHGTRGGIQQAVSLIAQWDSSIPNLTGWSYALPGNTFDNSVANTSGKGTVGNFPTTATLYPYGRAHFSGSTATYMLDLQWNITVPIKGTLAFNARFGIGNVFNTLIAAQGSTYWTPGATRTWAYGKEPSQDPNWGKNVATRTDGRNWGVSGVEDGSARQWAPTFDFGIRF